MFLTQDSTKVVWNLGRGAFKRNECGVSVTAQGVGIHCSVYDTLVGMLVALNTRLPRLSHKRQWQRIDQRKRLFLRKHTVNYAAVWLVILQVHTFQPVSKLRQLILQLDMNLPYFAE